MKRPSKKRKTGVVPEITEVSDITEVPSNGAEPTRMADEGPTQPYVQVPDFGGAEETTAVDEGDGNGNGQDPAAGGGAGAHADAEASWDGPTRPGGVQELADLAARASQAEGAETAGEGEGSGGDAAYASTEVEAPGMTPADGDAGADADPDAPAVESTARLESIIESLLFASDRPLTVAELKRLLGERDTKKVSVALEALSARHDETGIQLSGVAGGWQFRTHPQNGPWVSKLVAAKPQRLSRALLETLSIVAYRQPITRPEIDEIRGVDCGPVLKTLLERGLVRSIGKKEDVGRPLLYGTTPEFLRTFSLKDLAELPTLREFHELSAQQMAEVDAKTEAAGGGGAGGAAAGAAAGPGAPPPAPVEVSRADPDEEERLLDELDRATAAATKATAPPPEDKPPEGEANGDANGEANGDAQADAGGPSGPEAN